MYCVYTYIYNREKEGLWERRDLRVHIQSRQMYIKYICKGKREDCVNVKDSVCVKGSFWASKNRTSVLAGGWRWHWSTDTGRRTLYPQSLSLSWGLNSAFYIPAMPGSNPLDRVCVSVSVCVACLHFGAFVCMTQIFHCAAPASNSKDLFVMHLTWQN